MITEFEVRRELSEIERACTHPLRKVRRLILMARRVRHDACKLRIGARILEGDCMDEQANRLRRMVGKLVDLNREVMDLARNVLTSSKRSAGQDISARPPGQSEN